MQYLVVGLFADNNQRYSTTVEADTPEHAEAEAQEICAAANEMEEGSEPLLIAAVITGNAEVVA